MLQEGKMARTNFEKLRVYQLSEKLSDQLWEVVLGWNNFARDTVGKQLVRAADSVGANIAEGTGRGRFLDNRRFVRIARGSLNETQYWLRRAYKRILLTKRQTDQLKPLIDELAPTLNAYLKSIGETPQGSVATK
jgi:four helix bundle protein